MKEISILQFAGIERRTITSESAFLLSQGNGAGKTSLLRAIRVALAAALPAKPGMYGYNKEKNWIVEIKSGKNSAVVDTRQKVATTSYVNLNPISTGEKTIDSISEADLRRVMMQIANVKAKEYIGKYALANGISEEHQKVIVDLLVKHRDWDFAYDETQANIKKAKDDFKRATAETFSQERGERLAKTAYDEYPNIEELSNALMQKVGASQVERDRIETSISETKERAERSAGDPPCSDEYIEGFRLKILEKRREMPPPQGKKPQTHPCPNCKVELVVSHGVPYVYKEEAQSVDDDLRDRLQKEIDSLETTRDKLVASYNAWEKEAESIDRAKNTLDGLYKKLEDLKEGELTYEEASQRIREMKDANEEAEKIKRGVRAFTQVNYWKIIGDALSPKGVRMIALMATDKIINEKIAELSEAIFGYVCAKVEDAKILHYSRLHDIFLATPSESEMWRTNTIFQLLAPSQVILVDRADVCTDHVDFVDRLAEEAEKKVGEDGIAVICHAV